MTVSRWKVMAGVLGASLGGLAAIAGQSPKVGETRRAEPPMTESPLAPKPASVPSIDVPPPATLPVLPAATSAVPAPLLTEPPISADKKPAKPDVTPASGLVLPGLPVVPAGGTIPPPTTTNSLPVPIAFPAIDPPSPKPATPAAPAIDPFVPAKPAASGPLDPPALGGITPPAPSVPTPSGPLDTPVSPRPSSPTVTPDLPSPRSTASEPAAPIRVAPAAVAAAATKFRIILRVGEGDPTFEVRTGDDLMMKVACEKVDIASAEKGQPMQQVKASGKVRFVGFGSEGTCDELSFVAGTGELQLAGNVTIQVKDKLGRVDSELKSDKVKYKIDASALPGVMKP